jgi:hypothetical protein
MTDQHRATPDQWAKCTSDAETWSGAFNCILELRSRIEALELAFRAQTGSLTPAEQVELGVVPVSDVKAAVEPSVNHTVHDLKSSFGAASSPIVFKHIFTAGDIIAGSFYFDPNGINVHLGILDRFEVRPGDYVKVAHLPGVEPRAGVCSLIDYRVLSVVKGVGCLYITVVPLSPVIHDSSCLLGAFNTLCAYARISANKRYDGITVDIGEQIEMVKAALASRFVLTSLRDRLPGPDDVATYPAGSKVIMAASGIDADPWCWVARYAVGRWLFKPATIQWITIKKIKESGFNSRIPYTHWVPAAAFPLPTYCPEVSDAD